MNEFIFLRPMWLLAFIPALWLVFILWRKQSTDTIWQTVFDQQLLERLWLEPPGQSTRLPLLLLAAGWCLAILILAGPVWERQPEPVWRSQMSRILILDLSQSMNAKDITPSRLERARFKIMDILEKLNTGRIGLVVFAHEAHVVTPLTEDNETIKNLITALSTEIMPVKGDAAATALQLAADLLKLTGGNKGELLLISDGISDPAAAMSQAHNLRKQGYQLSVLGIGTEQGAIVSHSNGIAEFVRFDASPLQALAHAGGGTFSLLTTDNTDLNHLLSNNIPSSSYDKVSGGGVDRWVERGVLLLPLIVLLAAMAFRRGWLMGFVMLAVIPPPAQAFDWQDLWLRSDQQAQISLKQGDPQTAAQQFRHVDWRGMALYEAGDYQAAAQAFAESDDKEARYNQGNALAKAGDLKQAVAAYQEVLDQNPGHEDAKANLELVEKLLQQSQNDDTSPQEDGDSDQSSNESSKNNGEESQHLDEETTENTTEEPPEDDSQSDEMDPDSMDSEQQSASQPAEPTQPDQQDLTDQQSQNEHQENPASLLTDEKNALPSESDIALEQWLRQIPEDPSGLLRRKFMLEHLQRKQSR